MSANDRMPSLWSRRWLLVALAAGSVTAVSGCRVQLEEDAPRIPLVPTRVPMKDEKTLLAVLENTRSLGSMASALSRGSTSMAGRLSAVHATQLAVITRLLQDGGVPQSMIETPATSAPSPAAPSPAELSTAKLSTAEIGSLNDVSLADLSVAHVALIGSLLGQRIAAVPLLGGTVANVVPTVPGGAEGVALLEAARAAVYGFEIVATHIDSTGHALAMSALVSMRTRASELETIVGSSSPPPPLGYELPFPLTDSNSARRLALHLLETLLPREAAALEPAAGDAKTLATLVYWIGETEFMASQWRGLLSAFPGLANA